MWRREMGATYRARKQRHPRPGRDIVNRDAIEGAVIEPCVWRNLERPAEAAAVGAFGGFVLAAAYRQLTFGVVKESVFLRRI